MTRDITSAAVCVRVHHVAVWQTQLPKMDPPVTGKKPHSVCLTPFSAARVSECAPETKESRPLLYEVAKLTNYLKN